MEKMNNRHGFTLMEVIITIIILGIIVSFGVPQYFGAIAKSHERDAILQLKSIHSANVIYKAQVGNYLNTLGTDIGLPTINTELKLKIVANGLTYNYNSANGSSYTSTALKGGGEPFTVRITEAALGNTNPCCVNAGECQIVSDCP